MREGCEGRIRHGSPDHIRGATVAYTAAAGGDRAGGGGQHEAARARSDMEGAARRRRLSDVGDARGTPAALGGAGGLEAARRAKRSSVARVPTGGGPFGRGRPVAIPPCFGCVGITTWGRDAIVSGCSGAVARRTSAAGPFAPHPCRAATNRMASPHATLRHRHRHRSRHVPTYRYPRAITMSATARILRGSRSGAATAFRTNGATRTMSALAPTDTFVGEYTPWWRCAHAAPASPPPASTAYHASEAHDTPLPPPPWPLPRGRTAKKERTKLHNSSLPDRTRPCLRRPTRPPDHPPTTHRPTTHRPT